jgi:hypothetical protein
MYRPIGYKSINRNESILLLLLALTVFSVVGCAPTGIQVMPVSNRYVLALSSDDVVRVMRRAGFSDSQVLEFGPGIRDGLAQSGAVQIKVGKKIEVVFAIRDNSVYITTRLRGNFIYNLDTGWVGGGG